MSTDNLLCYIQEVNKLLLEASKKGEEVKVRALLERGADVQARESDKVSIPVIHSNWKPDLLS